MISPAIIACAALGYTAESIFGFGGSIITFLLATRFIPAHSIISMLPIFATVGSMMILYTDYRSADWRFILKVSLYAIPGLVLGSIVMERMPERSLSIFVLSLIILYGVNLVAGKDPEVPRPLRNPLYVLSGFIIGATSLGVLFIPVLGAQLGHRSSFRASLALLWTILAIARVPMYALTGILTTDSAIQSLAALPVIIIGILVGHRIHKLIPEAHYKRIVGVVIVVAATANLFL